MVSVFIREARKETRTGNSNVLRHATTGETIHVKHANLSKMYGANQLLEKEWPIDVQFLFE